MRPSHLQRLVIVRESRDLEKVFQESKFWLSWETHKSPHQNRRVRWAAEIMLPPKTVFTSRIRWARWDAPLCHSNLRQWSNKVGQPRLSAGGIWQQTRSCLARSWPNRVVAPLQIMAIITKQAALPSSITASYSPSYTSTSLTAGLRTSAPRIPPHIALASTLRSDRNWCDKTRSKLSRDSTNL